MLRDLVQSNPELAAVAVLVFGVILARVAALLSDRLLALADRASARLGGYGRNLLSPVVRKGVSVTVFAVVLALSVIVAVRVLSIEQLSGWLDALLAYVPRFVLGLVIIGAGTVAGTLARTVTASMMSREGGDALLPRLTQIAVVLVAVVTGLQQIGIDISFITQLALIGLAGLLAGLSLAFALGARDYVANLMGQSELSRYAPGDRLRIDDAEGEVVEIHRTGLTLATGEGLLSVPAAQLTRGRVLLLRVDHGEETADD